MIGSPSPRCRVTAAHCAPLADPYGRADYGIAATSEGCTTRARREPCLFTAAISRQEKRASDTNLSSPRFYRGKSKVRTKMRAWNLLCRRVRSSERALFGTPLLRGAKFQAPRTHDFHSSVHGVRAHAGFWEEPTCRGECLRALKESRKRQEDKNVLYNVSVERVPLAVACDRRERAF